MVDLDGIIFGEIRIKNKALYMKYLIFVFFFLFGFIYCSGQTKTTQVSFSGYVDGYYVQASGNLEYRFSWLFSPEVKAEFINLKVTRIDYEGVQYDYLKNNRNINFPYSCSGYATLTEVKCSMPYGGFLATSKNLYATPGLTTFDFATESFKQRYNNETAENKNKIVDDWVSSPYIYDVKILKLHSSVISGIIDDIKRTLRQEAEEKEKKEEKERLAKLEKEKEEKELKRQAEEEKAEELKRQAEEENKTGSSASGGENKKSSSSKKDKESKSKEKSFEKEDQEKAESSEVDDSYKYRMYADAKYKAGQYERNGNIREAIRWYKVALGYSYNLEIENKIKSLETQQDLNTVAVGTATFITGFNDAFDDASRGRINRLVMSSAFHVSKSTYEETFPSKSSKVHMEAHLGLDWYFWMAKKKLAFHLGFFGDYASINDKAEFQFSDDYWTFDSEKLIIGGRSGINLFGIVELDYVFRGLKLKAEYSYQDPNYTGSGISYIDVPYGGKLHFDGGLRAAIYLARKAEFFVRASGWYINGSGDGMLSMVDTTPASNSSYTKSKGLRLEIVKRPWSFGIFRTNHFYSNSLTNDLTMNTWGVGVLFGGGGR